MCEDYGVSMYDDDDPPEKVMEGLMQTAGVLMEYLGNHHPEVAEGIIKRAHKATEEGVLGVEIYFSARSEADVFIAAVNKMCEFTVALTILLNTMEKEDG